MPSPPKGRKNAKGSRSSRSTAKLRRSFHKAFGVADSSSSSETIAPLSHRNIDHTSAQNETEPVNASAPPIRESLPRSTDISDNSSKLKDFKERIFSDPSTPVAVRQLWKSLFEPPSTRGYSWKKHTGPFAPFESEFSLGWIRLFLSVPWTKAQWGLMRVFVLWLCERQLHPPTTQIREYKSMKALTGCFPGVGLSRKICRSIWRPRKDARATHARVVTEARLIQSQESSTPSQRLRGTLKAMESADVKFHIHPLQTQLILLMLVPNARGRIINPAPRAPGGVMSGVWEAPGLVYRHLLRGGYVVVRDQPSMLTLQPGCQICNTQQRRIAIVTKLRWEQPSHYLSARERGLPSRESAGWENIHDRRPFVTVLMALFRARNPQLGVLDAAQTYCFVRKKVAVSFGKCEGRISTKGLPIADRDWFADWSALPNAHLKRANVTHMSERLAGPESILDPDHTPRRLVSIWALQRERAKLIGVNHAQSPNRDIHCSVGWDGFSSSHFGGAHRSSVGFYVHVLNSRARFPTLPFCIADKSVPVRCVLREMWKQLSTLRQPNLILSVHQSVGSQSFEVELFDMRILLSAVCLDKEMLDQFQLAASSSAASRCDGAMYRGYQDGLHCEDICSLDGRYLRNMDHTCSSRSAALGVLQFIFKIMLHLCHIPDIPRFSEMHG